MLSGKDKLVVDDFFVFLYIEFFVVLKGDKIFISGCFGLGKILLLEVLGG